MNSISADHPDHEEAANGVPLSSSVGASRREQDPKSGREKQADTQGLMSAHQDQPLRPTPGTIHEITPMAVKQAPAVAGPERRLMRTKRIVIHLANDDHALRVARLDTGTDLNYINSDIVNSLGLEKEPKQEHLYKLVGRSYVPHWQVRFDWHIAEFYKTYTSTFEVLDGAHSGDFGISLGRGTINKVGLYAVVKPVEDSETPSLTWGSTPAFPPNLAAITWGVDEDSETPSLTEGSTLSTSGSTEEVREAAEAIAELLMADDVLGPLYKKALAVLKIDDLEKRFRKLLKACATELRTEASNNTQQSASKFLRRRVRYVVNHMGTCLDPQRKEKAQRLQELASEEPNKRAQVHAYINDGAVGSDVQKPDAVSDSGSSEQDAPENLYSLPREQVKSFILNSVALVNLRNKFSQFVLQRQSQGESFIGTLPDSPSAARVLVVGATQGEPVPLEPNLAADGIIDGSDVSPGSLNVAGREHPYDKDETRPREHFLWAILQRHAYLSRCIQIVLQVAEFLELRERMLEPGFKRVGWTCVSASQRLFAH
ncbi:MAG: hypothetical protein LQ339_005997 [Xanthoria mediterranea]|nr:MAG: hypothetical protein LQ339_005997 [Xanthoria mediterranea]